MSNTLTLTTTVHLRRGAKGQVELRPSAIESQVTPTPTGRVPRLSRLMALSIHFEDLLRRGEVKDLAELARVGHVTRARVTQIMNLLMLAPDIQEQILFLPDVTEGRDPVKEWQVRTVAAEPVWRRQRVTWRRLERTDRRA